jgi:hypothetical protein
MVRRTHVLLGATVALLAALIRPDNADADSTATGTVTSVTVSNESGPKELGFVTVSGSITNKPACSIGRFVFDLTTTAGRGMLATAIAASTSARSVQVNGTQACGLWPDSETLHFIIMN